MHRGDTILIEEENEIFSLIFIYSIEEHYITISTFMICGTIFKNKPKTEELKNIGLLGNKYFDKSQDLINSIASIQNQTTKGEDFYNGIKYDIVSIPLDSLKENISNIKVVSNLKIKEAFYPRPDYHFRKKNYKELIELIRSRILKIGEKSNNGNVIYDSYPIIEILEE